MRLYEFDNQLAATVKSNLLFLKSLSDDHNVIKVDALINLLKKQHILFSYDGLKELVDNDPSLNNIIKDFNKEEITLGDEEEDKEDQLAQDAENAGMDGMPQDEEEPGDDENIEDKVGDMSQRSMKNDRVAKMASSAAKRRS